MGRVFDRRWLGSGLSCRVICNMTESKQFSREISRAPSSPCGETCIPLAFVTKELDDINERLEKGDKSLEILPQLAKSVEEMNAKLDKTHEIVEAWGNIKGFGKAMKTMAVMLKVFAVVVSALGAVYVVLHDPVKAYEKVKGWFQ